MYSFIDHSKVPNYVIEKRYEKLLLDAKECGRLIVIIRPTLFFYPTQEITLGKLREYFTDHAITKLIGDGYVKFKDNKKKIKKKENKEKKREKNKTDKKKNNIK